MNTLVTHQIDDTHIKIFTDILDKNIEKELIATLKEGINYEITLLNIKIISLKLLLKFEKFKKNILFIVNENRLKYYLLNFDFSVESSDENLLQENILLEKTQYVAIGGSAGSLKKFIEIVKYLPASNITFFIIMHQKSDNISHLSHILQKYTTSYEVLDAKDNQKIKPASIYIAQPDRHLEVENGHIFLRDTQPKNFSKPSISVTFSSLSKAYKEALLCVLVCGYGSDGSDALKEVRKNGGVVIIEQLYECQATAMLESAIDTKQFDKILSIKDLMTMLYERISKENSIVTNLESFLEEIYIKYGYDYRGYQQKHILRRVENFYNSRGYKSFYELQNDVLQKRKIFEELFLNISINVTTFFRNPDVFREIKKEIKKRFLKNNSIKVWCAGCSSGEEPYSMAILLKELGVLDKSIIYATDINDIILEYAKIGAYSTNSFEVFKEHYLRFDGDANFDQYFNKYSGFVTVKKELKDKILFFKHNLSLDKAPNQFQLIMCRNVIIYFNRDLTLKVFHLFDESLNENGLLVLGESEVLYEELQYNVINEEKKIYQKGAKDV